MFLADQEDKMAGEPSFIEIGVLSTPKAREFYVKLFGWAVDDMDKGFCAKSPTLQVGVHPDDDRLNMVVYFAVDDIDAAAKRVRELGGSCDEPGPETPGFGRFCEC